MKSLRWRAFISLFEKNKIKIRRSIVTISQFLLIKTVIMIIIIIIMIIIIIIIIVIKNINYKTV